MQVLWNEERIEEALENAPISIDLDGLEKLIIHKALTHMLVSGVFPNLSAIDRLNLLQKIDEVIVKVITT